MQFTRSSKRLNLEKEVDIKNKSALENLVSEEMTDPKLKYIRKAITKITGI